jgi:hypothetical protein
MQHESWQRALGEQRRWRRGEAEPALGACEASGMTTAGSARRHGGTAVAFYTGVSA